MKNAELHRFYELYPEKFNNKTNGITFRRWLLECDPTLTAEIEKLIGSGFPQSTPPSWKSCCPTPKTSIPCRSSSAVKAQNKQALADWLRRTQNVTIDPNAMFDIQSKRLHEYKRQQLNLLYLIHQYYEIKAGHLPATPLVSIFGAKAAPAYIIAKDIIHALLTLSRSLPLTRSFPSICKSSLWRTTTSPPQKSSSPPATCPSRFPGIQGGAVPAT